MIGISNNSVHAINTLVLEKEKSRMYEEQIYNELRENKNSIVNAGSKYRLEKLYGITNTENGISTSQLDEDITEEEKKEILKRKRIEEDLNETNNSQQLKLMKE